MPGCATSNVPSLSCWPTTNTPTCSCRSVRANRTESHVPADHLHEPLYLEFDEGVEHFAKVIADLIPRGATVAVDEMTGAMRRAQDRLFPSGPPLEAAAAVSAAQLVKTPDEVACIRKACRITEEAIVDVQKAVGVGVRQIDLSARVRATRHSSSARPRTCSKRSGR